MLTFFVSSVSQKNSMIWHVNTIRTQLILTEINYDLTVPLLIEIEYCSDGTTVECSSLTHRAYYNRPLLIKEAKSHSAEELNAIIDEAIKKAIMNHFATLGLKWTNTLVKKEESQ